MFPASGGGRAVGQPADAKPANRWTSQRWKASPVLVRLRKGMLYMVGSFGWGFNQAACMVAGLAAAVGHRLCGMGDG